MSDSQSTLISKNGAVMSAFVLTRVTMAFVILGTLALGGVEQQDSALFVVQLVVSVAAVVALVLSSLVIAQRLRKRQPTQRPPAFLIALDSVLAIGVMAVIDVDTSPLAWVALITPVLETAVLFSMTGAAFTWFGLSLAFLALRLTTNISDDATTETLVLSIQQVLAVLFVSGPAALMADSAQDRIESLADARRSADLTTERLRRIAQSAREMSGGQSLDEILSVACESAASIGFAQADVVVRDASGAMSLHSTNANGAAANLPADLLSDRLEGSVGSLYADDPAAGQTLRLANIGSGHALEISNDAGKPSAVLRVWSQRDQVSGEDLRLLALLGGHAREAYRAAELLAEAEAHADQLLYQVRHDALTGLANRNFVLETLTAQLEKRQALALFFIDLDGFKGINDTLGHEAGDDALIAVADRLRTTGREGALAGRMGGDEFVVLVPMTNFDNIETLVAFGNQIVQVVSEPIVAAGQPAQLGASIGIAIHDGVIGADQLISLADHAMYEAKRSGGGAHVAPASLALYQRRAAS